MPLWRPFFHWLRERGVDSICVPLRFKCKWELPQCVAVWLLVGRYKLCVDQGLGEPLGFWEGVALLGRRGGAKCKWRLARECPAGFLPVDFEPPRTPRFVIDLSLWGEHMEGEKHELVEQILASLNAVREFYWDGNLWLTHVPGEFLQFLQRHALGLVHKMNIAVDMPPLSNPVVLDPRGECVFDTSLKFAEVIIGGIVDKEIARKGATSRLADMLGVERRCRIELRGSVVGVPDRINKIVEIVAKALEGVPLERAILEAQARRDRVYRLMWEIQRRAARGPGGRLVISRSALEEANWLGAPLQDVELALRKLRAVVKD